MRKAGVLMAVSSLPSKYGVGDFGESCLQFIDDLKKGGFRIWQILPLNPLGYGNSPYQAYSSKAMDELYLSLDELQKMGLIKKTKKLNAQKKSVDYEQVRQFKQHYYHEAYANFKKNKAFDRFAAQKWVQEYAVFITFKKLNQMKSWHEWPCDQKNWIKEKKPLPHLKQEIDYEIFLQYMLFCQWMKVKRYANKKGIEIMGDLPFYVGLDSVDVWANPSSFLLDEDGHPYFIAGVPPDYFSVTGQRWGNPIYDWEYLHQHHFEFWIDRLAYQAQCFDLLRIDHFRAFDTYWKIPSSCLSAVEGEWVEAPGYAFFDTLFEQYPDLHIVAEDLGDLRMQVHELRDHYQLLGMKVLQFVFDPWHPYDDCEHVVAYTGTHDNLPILSWFASQEKNYQKQTRKFLKEAGYHYEHLEENIMAYLLDSKAELVILPMQDILGLNHKSRMNQPGSLDEKNWCWKMASLHDFEQKASLFRGMIRAAHR